MNSVCINTFAFVSDPDKSEKSNAVVACILYSSNQDQAGRSFKY